MNLLRRWSVSTQNLTVRNRLKLAQLRNYQRIRRFGIEREDFGAYNVILPSEPFIFGVNHIHPRVVPDHIVRPQYAYGSSNSNIDTPSLRDNEKINLGGEAELRIREAALLAKKVREFASTQVKVRVVRSRYCQERRINTTVEIDFNTWPGWSNDECNRRCYSRFYHQSFSVSISSTIFWLSSIVLYQVRICFRNLI